MQNLPAIVVTGASGRMGQMLIRAITGSKKMRLGGAIVRSGSPWLGRDVADLAGGPAQGIVFSDDPLEAFAKARIVIDFTSPTATVDYAAIAAQARLVHVIGTTGFEAGHLAKLAAAARHAVIIRSGNMSLGVNVLQGLVEKAARALDADWDIEIIEAHHNQKKDAPSGTALMLGEAAAAGRGAALADVRAPMGHDGMRASGSIGFSAVRGGDIVGEHDVLFAGMGERLILRHVASDRTIFARGALKAALWGLDQKPGAYTMQDVLGNSL